MYYNYCFWYYYYWIKRVQSVLQANSNIYNKQHDKNKINYIEIKESRQLLVQRKYP
jgi:hypothetical protein